MSLRDQILQKWGKYGQWDASGVDRAEELARLFEANGITDLGQLNTRARTVELQPGRFEDQGRYVDVGSGDSQYSVWEPKQTWVDPVSETINDLYYGDKRLDFLGDVNRDNSISKVGSESQGDRIGWSSAGKGAVGFHKYGSGDNFYVAPSWGPTSDKKHIIGAISAIAAPYAMASGIGALSSAFGGAASAVPISETIATLAANGLTDAEIAAIIGGQAGADLVGAGSMASMSGPMWEANTSNLPQTYTDPTLTMSEPTWIPPDVPGAPDTWIPPGNDVVHIVDKLPTSPMPSLPTIPTVPPVPIPSQLQQSLPQPDQLPQKSGIDRFTEWFAKNPQLGITGISTLINAFKGKGDSGPTVDPNAPGSQANFTTTPPTNLGRTYMAPPEGYRAGFDPEHRFFTGIGPLGTGDSNG